MREFKVKRLLVILYVILGILVFVFVPYYIGIWLGYRVQPATMIPNGNVADNTTLYFAEHDGVTVLDVWLHGFIVTALTAIGLGILAIIGGLIYLVYDWVFPKKEIE